MQLQFFWKKFNKLFCELIVKNDIVCLKFTKTDICTCAKLTK